MKIAFFRSGNVVISSQNLNITLKKNSARALTRFFLPAKSDLPALSNERIDELAK